MEMIGIVLVFWGCGMFVGLIAFVFEKLIKKMPSSPRLNSSSKEALESK